MGNAMVLKNKGFQLIIAMFLGVIVLMLPRPEGTTFKIVGDENKILIKNISDEFIPGSTESNTGSDYHVKVTNWKK